MNVLPIGSIMNAIEEWECQINGLNKKWQKKYGSFWRNLLKSYIVSV